MPTIRRCCIVGCMSNSRLNPNLQFFQFPRPENPFYKLWTQACQASLSRILPFKKPVLCAEHFHPHCIGGRRLTSSAVPTLKLEVPTNLKAVEQQAMVEEIERSRKCAYINAVVYEWLVRANLNPQLRGSITHGMIKEKAETAKQIIGCETFTADNRWLNRFRESHLSGFAQKLASNQLKPMGPSLWIPDIVQDLQHLFPPTNAERMENFENVPEQYINYMKQYGEYEEDDESEQEQQPPMGYGNEQENSGYGEPKMSHQGYYPQQHHAPQNYYQQPPMHQAPPPHHHQSPPPPTPQVPPSHANGYNPYGHHGGGGLHHPASSYNAYHDYYAHERHYQQQPPAPPQPPPAPHHGGVYPSQPPMQHQPPAPLHPLRPMSHSPANQQQEQQRLPSPLQHQTPPPQQQLEQQQQQQQRQPSPIQQRQPSPMQQRQPSPIQQRHPSPIQQRQPSPMQHQQPSPMQQGQPSPIQQRQPSPLQQPVRDLSHSPRASPIDPLQIERTLSPAVKRPMTQDPNEDNLPKSKRSSPISNGSPIPQPPKSNDNFKIKLPLLNGNKTGPSSPAPASSPSNGTNSNSRSCSPKSQTEKGNTTNGRNSAALPSPASSLADTNGNVKDLETYAQALEYLKPLEDFALFKENFRAIGLISQLENILKKSIRPPAAAKQVISNGLN
uniref:HTH CENPB-type domain-containing protein n=1 Tax=Stomoxys calcitrans TaxID=35570 RepID=A0A1I8NP96_STOCA